MNKDWLHFPSLGRTIDFNVVSDIDWNYQVDYDKRFRTLAYLGTGIAAVDEYISERPHLSIFDKEDRKKLYAKFPGIPIDLLFDEAPIEEKVVEPTSFNTNNSDDIPY